MERWLVKNITLFIQKDPAKGNAIGNYWPMACLNLLWKLKTGIIVDEVYEDLENKHLLMEEQKDC